MAERCRVPGCEVMIFGNTKICGHHWHRVPKALQDALQQATLGDQYNSVLAACVEAATQPPGKTVLSSTNGHRR